MFKPFGIEAILRATARCEPIPPTIAAPGCPLLLEDLCLALLAKEPALRPKSAEEVARKIEEFLEGTKEKQRKHEEARRLCALAEQPVQRHAHLEEERQKLVARARDMLKDVKGWEPVAVNKNLFAIGLSIPIQTGIMMFAGHSGFAQDFEVQGVLFYE